MYKMFLCLNRTHPFASLGVSALALCTYSIQTSADFQLSAAGGGLCAASFRGS